MVINCFFFFSSRRRHTRYWRDWSSDVCSSDLDGGIVAGLWGYEAGQSGVGDIFAWFTANAVPGEFAEEAARQGVPVQQLLDEKAGALPAGGHGLVALDWEGGNRSVLVDGRLSGVIVGLT